eukprot:TRINITY_DN14737_c0_g1_i1.p1 TRINITY_DN14737_c0_g1~~TRINITY_DN14737_c0_g1_i1.p1  ORF type:complete len:638 (+),score=91.84 TRINITY_DN14737_c0_g1_i1:159-1916(+)
MEGHDGCQLIFDRVQGDPYAAPSWVRVRLPSTSANFPDECALKSRVRNVALCDFITRVLSDMLQGGTGTDWTRTLPRRGWSSSKGGSIHVEMPGQYVLPRTSVVINRQVVEARLTLSLPARGRSIEGHRASQIIGGLMDVVKRSLYFESLDKAALWSHVRCVEDQDDARQQLFSLGLVAFVANGSVLPRKSGIDDRPLTLQDTSNLVEFKSPASLETRIVVPNKGCILGMGIRRGITMIVGGGFHGKSTLLQALQFGVYNKVQGDGREFVLCDPNAVKIRSEDGRWICCTDISPFISNLPFGLDTSGFSTADASGSTSQAANIIEALELGATALLIDEDTCATNFMIRDAAMVELVAPEKEPITPFIRKVRSLFDCCGVSTIVVIGGTGDFFPVADTVVCMDRYQASNLTTEAQEVAKRHGCLAPRPELYAKPISCRVLLRSGLAADWKVSAKSLRCICYGNTEIELSFVEQFAELGQVKAVMACLQHLAATGSYVDGKRTLPEIVTLLERELTSEKQGVGQQGLDVISKDFPCPFHVLPRRFEIAAALNRLRTAKVVKQDRQQGASVESMSVDRLHDAGIKGGA